MKKPPNVGEWLAEAKAHESAGKIGMYLGHNGIVRESAKAKVRGGDETAADVSGMVFRYDEDKVMQAVKETYDMNGVYYVRTWLNSGKLSVGDDIMYVLIGGDIRPNVVAALESLVEKLKTQCVTETEI